MPRRLRITLLICLLIGVATAAVVVLRQDDDVAGDPDWATCSGEVVGEEQVADLPTDPPALTATQVAALEAPTDLTTRPGDEALYVAERAGTVYRVPPDGEPEPILEVETIVTKEQGLLSITFDPTGEHLYVNHTDPDSVSRVVAYPIDADGQAGEPVEILSSQRTRANHNVNDTVFGPDGYLYVSAGDGGVDPIPDTQIEEGDPQRRAQDLNEPFFGKILRIEPDPVGGGYAVPVDNPYVDDPDAAPEVWAAGFRNPWRFSFDEENGEVWIADVGHYCAEEINHVSADDAPGANYGWSAYEGYLRHHEDQDPADHVLPIHTYRRGDVPERPGVVQCAVIGGHVYRGTEIPDLDGTYLFGDFCAGEVHALRFDEDGAVDVDLVLDGLSGMQSMAEDDAGELYVLAGEGAYRIGPAGP